MVNSRSHAISEKQCASNLMSAVDDDPFTMLCSADMLSMKAIVDDPRNTSPKTSNPTHVPETICSLGPWIPDLIYVCVCFGKLFGLHTDLLHKDGAKGVDHDTH